MASRLLISEFFWEAGETDPPTLTVQLWPVPWGEDHRKGKSWRSRPDTGSPQWQPGWDVQVLICYPYASAPFWACCSLGAATVLTLRRNQDGVSLLWDWVSRIKAFLGGYKCPPSFFITNIKFCDNPLILHAFSLKESCGQCSSLLVNTFYFSPFDTQDFDHFDIYLNYSSWTWLRTKLLPLLSAWDHTSVEKELDGLIDRFIHSNVGEHLLSRRFCEVLLLAIPLTLSLFSIYFPP